MSETRYNVATAPKTGTFQMRINPEIKQRVEEIFANCGMTLTDAVNVFLQQSINVEGLPFVVNQNSEEAIKEQAKNILMMELIKGEESARQSGWLSEEEVAENIGVKI